MNKCPGKVFIIRKLAKGQPDKVIFINSAGKFIFVPYGESLIQVDLEPAHGNLHRFTAFWNNDKIYLYGKKRSLDKWFVSPKIWMKLNHDKRYNNFIQTGKMKSLWKECKLKDK